MSIKDRFDSLSPGHKKVVVWSMIGAVFLGVTVVGYKASRSGDDAASSASVVKKTREISLEPDLIQKTMLREQRREMDALKKEVEQLRKERENWQATTTPPAETAEETRLPEVPTADQVVNMNGSDKLEPLPLPGSRFPMPPGNTTPPPPPPEEVQVIGAIGVLTNQEAAADVQVAGTDNQKKKKRTVYLPPSFMEARLLTGFDASTAGNGKNNPEPILLRIQTPAVLPNDIKANLRGCFVIAEAVGRLNKERADVRLVSLSCISNEGNAVIDTTIKGFVTDSDSKVGLSGRVVSKMGAATARAVVAGLFDGAGRALQSGTQTQAVSALGVTSVVDTDQLVNASIGGGLSEGANTLSDLYLDMAKQATPVIEVGASKKITVIISEGKELEIKEFKNDEL
ncbi:hypothetical protein GF1_16290 [Desulfolithobacter dissulfuricans]|uniref:Conjugal transfer protein TraB n=1 Tax=Desulfolithobacter dissulfuricans TaxID=2795293 RepID=A0A915XKI1_9BACT|nr:TrbI/VirB10 family protein [Desulfolithobacter dissulfuricans]BCO09253.1 hypothetical protein GF1_16290 [Desulfolithobacter dissulfuricans]